jgi:vitamin B12 transporter
MAHVSLMVLLIVMLAASGAAAQTPDAGGRTTQGSPARPLDPIVSTATRLDTPESRLGASVTVVTGDEIVEKQYPTVEEALRHVPGVDIQRSGGLGKTVGIRIRGAGTQQIQVLVDGLRVKSPTLGTAELSDLSVDAIERIEVVRGPQSTLYGADAIGGVVNIITKKGQGPPRGVVQGEAGTFETYREAASVSGSWNAFSYTISGSHYDTRGYLKNDDATQSALAARFDYDFPWKGTLSLKGRYIKNQVDLPIFSTNPTVFDPNSQQQSETWLYTITYDQHVTDWWQTQVRYGQWLNRSGFQNPPPPGTFTTISQIDTERREAEWLNHFAITKWNTLSVGLEHRDENGNNRHTFREAINVESVSLQDELRLFDRVFLGGGVRYEENDTFGESWTGRASFLVLFPETGSRLRGVWGEGFRAPTINDLFFPGFGNPQLAPESSVGWELGVDQRLFKDRLRFGAAYFRTDFKDLIQIIQIPGTFLFQPENVGRARTEGVEVYVEGDPVDWLTLYANYTYTHAEDRVTFLPLRRVPQNRWATGAVFTWDRLRLFAEAIVVSDQFETPTGPKSFNPGYHRVDFGGSYLIWGRRGIMERAELIARFTNITDEKYSEVFGFPAPRFNALIGLRVAFQ